MKEEVFYCKKCLTKSYQNGVAIFLVINDISTLIEINIYQGGILGDKKFDNRVLRGYGKDWSDGP